MRFVAARRGVIGGWCRGLEVVAVWSKAAIRQIVHGCPVGLLEGTGNSLWLDVSK